MNKRLRAREAFLDAQERQHRPSINGKIWRARQDSNLRPPA